MFHHKKGGFAATVSWVDTVRVRNQDVAIFRQLAANFWQKRLCVLTKLIVPKNPLEAKRFFTRRILYSLNKNFPTKIDRL